MVSTAIDVAVELAADMGATIDVISGPAQLDVTAWAPSGYRWRDNQCGAMVEVASDRSPDAREWAVSTLLDRMGAGLEPLPCNR